MITYLMKTRNEQAGQKVNLQVTGQKRKTMDATLEDRRDYLVQRMNEKPAHHKQQDVMGRHTDSLTREDGEIKALAVMITQMAVIMKGHRRTHM